MAAVKPAVRYGLGTYLAFAFSLLCVLVTAVLVVVSERMASDQVRSSIGSNLAELAFQTTSRLDRSMFERYREVGLMAQRLAREPDLAHVRAELDVMQQTYPHYAWVGLAGADGRVLASTGNLLAGADVAGRPWFQAARQGPHVGDVHEAVLLARLLPNPHAEPLRFVDIAFPVTRGSGPQAVLGAHLSWAWARQIEQTIFLPVGRNRAVEPLIVNAQGIVLLGPRDLEGRQLTVPSLDEAARGRTGSRIERWPDGQRYLVGYSQARGHQTYPGLGWRVLVRQDVGNAFEPVRDLQLHLASWGLGVAAVFSLLGWVAARMVTRPLKDLASAAREMEAGQAARPMHAEPYREVAQLGTALQSLVRALQQKEGDLRELNASLERRVEERTSALREAFEHVRENERRIQTILESAPDPFIGVDFQGRITDWNPRAEAMFGWRREEVEGRPFQDVLVPARLRAAAERAMQHFLLARPARGRAIERVVVDRAGHEIEVELRVGLVDSGKLQLVCAFMHDISRRKEIDRLKSEFVSTVSHELRTPLTAVYGSLRLLAAGVGGSLPPQSRQLLEMSTRSCERLIRLINDVLDVERIASGRLELRRERINLRPLLERAVHDTGPYAANLGVRLQVDAARDAWVLADADRITQVIVNLVSNAAKFSPRGDEVRIALAVHGGQARVGVLDHGQGIPPEFHARMFERFAQADGSDRREKGGTGLGLNICRSIVQAHGGSIGFQSEPGVRTEFWFELPLAG